MKLSWIDDKMIRDDVVMTKSLKFPKTFEYDILRYSTSFNKVSDQLTEFYGHFREFTEIGTRHDNFWNKTRNFWN